MKQITLYIMALTFSSACKTHKSVQYDSSQSVAKPIAVIKNYIVNDDVNKIEIEIVNTHVGQYRITSIIENYNQKIAVITNTKDMSGLEADTVLNFSKNDFINKLDYESSMSDKQLIIAGNSQTIKIRKGKFQHEFHTRRAFGLMRLLMEGKSNIN